MSIPIELVAVGLLVAALGAISWAGTKQDLAKVRHSIAEHNRRLKAERELAELVSRARAARARGEHWVANRAFAEANRISLELRRG